MPETRAQKRSQVDKPDPSIGHKRARRRSSDRTVAGELVRPVEVDQSNARLSAKARGKQPERVMAGRKDQCHVYLAGPEDFRSGLDEEGNDSLETDAEKLLHRGREWGQAEMQSIGVQKQAIGGVKNEIAGVHALWAGKRWRTLRMPGLRMYDLQEAAIRTWRYSAPPLPTALDLDTIGMSWDNSKMVSNIRDIPEWRRTSAAESFQLFRPQEAFKPLPSANDIDPETPSQRGSAIKFAAGAKGQTILLSPFSISNNSSEPLDIPRRPPDLEWLDPELDHLPDFNWGWDQGAGKPAQLDSQRESLTMWRQSLSGSQSLRQTPNQPLPVVPSVGLTDEAGMVSYLTDPSLIEETAQAEVQGDARLGRTNETSHYQPLPLRLAPFDLPRGSTPLAPLPGRASGPINKPTKRRKAPAKVVTAKPNPMEDLRDVKPMRQELSPFVLRPVQFGHDGPTADVSGPVIPEIQDNTAIIDEGNPNPGMDKMQDASRESDVFGVIDGDPLDDNSTPHDVQNDHLPKSSAASAQRLEMRDLMLHDRRFGQVFDAMKESLSLSAPEGGPAYTQIPNQAFGAPIKMPPTPHPFHPSLADLSQSRPNLRVRWLIPVHGPAGLFTDQDINPKFWPSPAIVLFDTKSRTIHHEINDRIMTHITKRRRRDHLVWTKETISKFWNETSKLRLKGTCGPISISLSGPHPDPFRPAIAPLSISTHRYVAPGVDSTFPPVRAHIGDHIRIGCDLEHALIFRMWLGTRTFGSKPTDYRSDTGAPSDKRTFDHNPFLRVKLCLIGPLGEVLAVI